MDGISLGKANQKNTRLNICERVFLNAIKCQCLKIV